MPSNHLNIELISKLKNENAFWSFDNKELSAVSDDVLIEKVLVHLDIDDIWKLFAIYPKKKIYSVWKEKILSQEPMYHGINRLYAFLLFDIKNPDRFIVFHKNKQLRSFECKD